jgi:hypothetical protein
VVFFNTPYAFLFNIKENSVHDINILYTIFFNTFVKKEFDTWWWLYRMKYQVRIDKYIHFAKVQSATDGLSASVYAPLIHNVIQSFQKGPFKMSQIRNANESKYSKNEEVPETKGYQ